jgi:protein AbiQ
VYNINEGRNTRSGVPYQNQVGAKKAVYPTKTKWERKKRSILFWVDHFFILGVVMWQLRDNRIVLIRISMEYTDFLRNTIDSKVPLEHMDSDNLPRPFIGILIMNNENQFVIPLTSPKAKHARMSNSLDFHKINGGEYGAINFNNMFPIINDDRIYQIIDTGFNSDCSEAELQYRNLVRNQLTWLNLSHNKALVLRKAENLYNLYISGELDEKVKRRCCNFIKLQEEYMNYQL